MLFNCHQVRLRVTVVNVASQMDPSRYPGCLTPQRKLPLAGWKTSSSAPARVIAVEPSAHFDGLWVTVQTDGHPGFHDRDIANCMQAPDGRCFSIGSAGS